jgi:hypothetical protein
MLTLVSKKGRKNEKIVVKSLYLIAQLGKLVIDKIAIE